METQTTGGLNASEEATLVALLNKVEQPWSAPLYNALAPHIVPTTIELVCLRIVEGKYHAFLIPRPMTDAHYPGQLHSPGTVFRANGETPIDAIKRIISSELGGSLIYVSGVLHEMYVNRTPRGSETPRIFVGLVTEKPAVELLRRVPNGTFYPVNELPENTMVHHREIIQRAASAADTRDNLFSVII